MKLRRAVTTAVLCLFLAVVCICPVFAETGVKETVRLTSAQSQLNITVDTVLDLDGYNVANLTVAGGVTVTVKDSQTDDYNSTNGRGYGKITTINGEGAVAAADGYLLVQNNGTSAHKLNLKISGVSVRATDLDESGAGMYYRGTFGGDQEVKDTIVAYGVALGVNNEPNFVENTYTRVDDLSAWVTGKTFTGNSTLLQGIMRSGNTEDINRRNSELAIYGQAYVELADGSYITGDCVQFTFREFVEGTGKMQGIDQKWQSLNADQKTAAQDLYNIFNSIVGKWGVPQIRQSIKGGAYEIYVPQDLRILGDMPEAKHELKANVDMTGVAWSMVESYYGTFNGNGYTISNLTVKPGSGKYVGMFSYVEPGSAIANLSLENITVDATGTGAQYVGGIAGYNGGSITKCTVTGKIRHDNGGSASYQVYVGALVGEMASGATTTPSKTLTAKYVLPNVNGTNKTYSVSNLCAKVNMDVPDTDYVVRALVGKNASSTSYSSYYWQDLSFNTDDDSAVAQSRRKTAVAEMVKMGTVKWTVPNLVADPNTPDLIHYGSADASDKESHIHTQRFYSGTTYYGIPYDHTSSSLEQFLAYMDEGTNGVYVLNETASSAGESTWGGETEKDAFGNTVYKGFTRYIGSDCSGAVAWGWYHAVGRSVNDGGVYVLLSQNMMPTNDAENQYGIYRVGKYNVNYTMTAVVDGVSVITTPVVASKNGTTVMYESYARAQMGDGLLYGEPGGHVRMLAMDSVVIRNGNGVIDGSKSFVITHEQGDGLYDRDTTNSSWRINYQYTFKELYSGTSSYSKKSTGEGYLPVTLKAYHDDSIGMLNQAPYEHSSITNPATGQLNAGNRILCVAVEVKDSNGNVVYTKTAYKGTNGVYNDYRAQETTFSMKYYFADYTSALSSGKTYTFSVDCTVAGGTLNGDGTISNTVINVVKDRAFTQK